jgi:5-methylthioadenosine/S-adenosylhomocysteine deaminase
MRRILKARWVVTMDPAHRVIRDGAVVVNGDVIESVGPAAEVDMGDAEILEFAHHALLPGLVNAHTHVAGCIFRGLTEDEPEGFYGLALPMERFLDADAIYALSLLGIAEVMLAGCTVIHDMFHYPWETARAAAELGIRAQIAHKVLDTDLTSIRYGRHDRIPAEGDRRLEENVRLYEDWHGAGEGRIAVRFGAHAADTCSPGLLRRIRAEARARGAGHHIHAAQTPAEMEYMAQTHGSGSIEFLARQDFLGPDVIVAHTLFADREEIGILHDTGTRVAHCPVSVSKTGKFPLIRTLYESGVPVGWGTDWVTMDPWDAMRTGITVSRVVTDDSSFLTADAALWRSTMGSAQILGWDDRVGSLEPGKQADLILMDVDQPHLAPMHHPVPVLVYNASGRDVTDVMVAGTWTVQDRSLTADSLHRIVEAGQEVAVRVWKEGGLEPIGMGEPVPEVHRS